MGELRTGHTRMHRFEASDGWPLSCYEYAPGPRAEPHPLPVLLVHGTQSRFTLFDLGEGVEGRAMGEEGLAPYLASRGFRVFSLDLRGRGQSLPASHFGRLRARTWRGWSVEDFRDRDLPAAIAQVCAITGAGALDYLGHSLGAILIFSLLARRPYLPVRRVVNVGGVDAAAMRPGSCDERFELIPRLYSASRFAPYLPLEAVMPVAARLAGMPWSAPLLSAFVHPPNMERGALRRVFGHALTGTSARKLESMYRWFQDAEGRNLAEGARYVHPTLHIAGVADRLVRPQMVAESLARGRHPESRMILLGRAHGHRSDYGHCDLLVGRHAHREVYPQITEWLCRPDMAS